MERRLLGDVDAVLVQSKSGLRRTVLGMVMQPNQEQDQFMAEEVGLVQVPFYSCILRKFAFS